MTIDNREIKRKKLKASENSYQEFLGEYIGLPRYSEKYKTANVNEIRHLLRGQTNTISQYESGLRNSVREGKVLGIKKISSPV